MKITIQQKEETDGTVILDVGLSPEGAWVEDVKAAVLWEILLPDGWELLSADGAEGLTVTRGVDHLLLDGNPPETGAWVTLTLRRSGREGEGEIIVRPCPGQPFLYTYEEKSGIMTEYRVEEGRIKIRMAREESREGEWTLLGWQEGITADGKSAMRFLFLPDAEGRFGCVIPRDGGCYFVTVEDVTEVEVTEDGVTRRWAAVTEDGRRVTVRVVTVIREE